MNLTITPVDKNCTDSYQLLIKFYLSDDLPCGTTVQPIISLPIEVVPNNISSIQLQESPGDQSNIDSVQNMCLKLHGSCVRNLVMDDKEIFALESAGYLGIGGKVWDSTYVLMRFLHANKEKYIENKSVIELGSGTGLAGMFSE